MTETPVNPHLYFQFLHALSSTRESDQRWKNIWRLIVAHPWYQTQLKTIARRLARFQVPPLDWEDVQHDALLLFARTLQRHPDLRFDPGQNEKRFEGWIRKIILQDCRQALRRLRRSLPTIPFCDEISGERHASNSITFNLEADLDLLLPEERLVIDHYLLGWTFQEISFLLELSRATVHRRFQQALETLRQPA